MLKKPQNVYLPIDKFQAKVFKKNEGERSEWVTKFALALAEEAEEPFAKELLNRAQADLYKDIVRGWRFNARRSLESSGISNPNDKQVHEKCIDEYGDEYIEALELLKASSKRIRNNISKMEADESTAGATTREDGVNRKSGTPATISREPEVLNLAYSGEFANVRLTQEQYNDLLQHVGNMNACKSLIDDFSASIADGSTKSDNHFATLKKWAKARKRFDSEKKDGAPTFQEREGKRQSEQLRKYGLLK